LMTGMAVHYAFTQRTWAKTHPDIWNRATAAVENMSSYSSRHVSEDDTRRSKLKYLDVLGEEVSSTSERRLQWLEILRALNASIPRTAYPDGKPPSPKELPFEDRPDIHILSIESKRFEDLSTWFSEDVAQRYREELRNLARFDKSLAPEDLSTVSGPTGPGWVFELKGYHYFNSPKRMGSEGSNHVRKMLITNLIQQPIALPDKQGNIIPFLPDELGLQFPLLLNDDKPKLVKIPNPDFDPETMAPPQTAGMGGGGAMMGPGGVPGAAAGGTAAGDKKEVVSPTLDVLRHDFIVQVVWQPNSLTERLKIREEKRKAAEEAEQAAQEGDAVAAVGN